MKVSTKSGSNIQWTEEAKLVIRRIVQLDGCQRLQKAALFEELYELCTTDDLISEKIAAAQFEEHSLFIYEAIVHTFPEEKKQYVITIESVHNTLKCGSNFMTADNKVIWCTKDEKKNIVVYTTKITRISITILINSLASSYNL